MKSNKLLSLVLLAAMVIALFASCSGSASTELKVIDIPLTEEEYAFGVDKNQPELLTKANEFIAKIMEDGTFDDICNHYFGDGTPVPVASAALDENKDQLVVATNAGFEPFEYTQGDNYLGIDMEIAKLFADYLGWELVISNMDFEAVCLSVGQSKCDIAMAGLTIKPEREEYVTFTDSYYNASQMVVVLADNTDFDECKSAADVEAVLNGYDSSVKGGYQNGTTGQFYVLGDEEWGFDCFKVEGVGYKNGSMAMQDMQNGNLGFVVIDEAPAKCISAALNG
ncbi:MAG: transporter substrate-binding domain-containing protein [Clostridia bacterium]|nr:transporter substrate-binding domain-containing protein [Clostridia bacterium]